MNETINTNRSICATRGEDPRAFPSVTSDTVSENPQISWYSWDYILPASSIVLTMKTNSQRKALTWITFLSRWWSTCQVGVQKVLALELHLFHLHSYWSGPDTKSKLEKNSHNWFEWWLMHIICKKLVISYFHNLYLVGHPLTSFQLVGPSIIMQGYTLGETLAAAPYNCCSA